MLSYIATSVFEPDVIPIDRSPVFVQALDTLARWSQYEFPEKPESIGLLQRLFHRPRLAPVRGDSIPLPDLAEGETSELVCLNCTHASRRNALAVFGLVPGSRLVLQQKRPAFVVRIGETELALEPSIASDILVKRLPDPAV